MASLLTEMPSVLDQREVWFTHLLLLGFDPVASEEKYKVTFTRDMFAHINKKGMEVVMHFLFAKLNSHLAYEEFRDCWPVYDKKQEQQFRKSCVNWLTKIAKEQPDSRLPRHSASLLISPGGDRFYQFLLRFTSYVLRTVCLRDAKSDEKQVFVPSFFTSPDLLHHPAHRDVCLSALRAHVVRHSQEVVDRLQLATALHGEWRDYSNKLTSEYRSHSKEGRQITKRIAALQEEQRQKALAGVSKGLPLSASDKKSLSLSAEVTAIKRKTRMQKARDLWKAVDDFSTKSAHQREVLDSVTRGKSNRHSVNASKITFQIPELILGSYEALVQQGKAGNTYEAGKLNILSLIQLWNCALLVLKDNILAGGVPTFDGDAQYVSSELQSHRSHLAAAQGLRASLAGLQGSLEESICRLESRLERLRGGDPEGVGQSPERGAEPLTLNVPPITVPSLALGLLPPSPQKPFSADRPSNHLSYLSFPTDSISTPEAVHNISRSVHKLSTRHVDRTKPSLIPQPTRPTTSQVISSGVPSTAMELPFPANTTEPPADTAELKPMPYGSVSARVEEHRGGTTSEKAAAYKDRGRPKKPASSGSITPHTTTVKPRAQGRRTKHRETDRSQPLGPGRGKGPAQQSVPPSQPGTENKLTSLAKVTKPVTPPLLDSMPRAHDILADQIAAAVASQLESSGAFASPYTPGTEIHSIVDPLSAMGTEAFVSRDKIARTPQSRPGVRRHRGLMSSLSPVAHSPVLPPATAPTHPAPAHSSLATSLPALLPSDGSPKLPVSHRVTSSPPPQPSLPITVPLQSHPTLVSTPPVWPPDVIHGPRTSPQLPPPTSSPGLKIPALTTPTHEPASHSSSPMHRPGMGHGRSDQPVARIEESEGLNVDKRSVLKATSESTLAASPHPPTTTPLTPSPLVGTHLTATLSTPIAPPTLLAQTTTTPQATISSAMPPTRKVAFEQTPLDTPPADVPVTPPTLFASMQPPTPFQHANFDLESSDEEESERLGKKGEESEEETEFSDGSFQTHVPQPKGEKSQGVVSSDQNGHSGTPSPTHTPHTPQGGDGSLHSPDNRLSQEEPHSTPTEVAVGDLIRMTPDRPCPPTHQQPPLSTSSALITTTASFSTDTMVSHEGTRGMTYLVQGVDEGGSPPVPSSHDALLSYLPTVTWSSGASSAGTQQTPMETSGLNLWLTGDSGEVEVLGDQSPFLAASLSLHSLSLTSSEEPLPEQSSA